LDGIYILIQLSDWPLVEVTLLLIGLTHISFDKKPVLTSSLSDCQLWMLGDEDTSIEIVYGEEKNILYWADQSSRGIKKNLLYRHDKPNQLTKEEPRSFVLHKSPLSSVSTVSRGPPLSSLSG
jgi:hypothetical protein